MARAAAAGGADALVCCNTLLGLAVDWRARRTRLPLGMAGYSGPPVKPVALRVVWQVARAVDLPVIGVGGITGAEDVLEFIAAGASAVQVGTASLARPDAMARILAGVERLLAEEGVAVSDLVGALHPAGRED
jgi:dihydroorotate dehydrogenase (NAD+) catalytic subunit